MTSLTASHSLALEWGVSHVRWVAALRNPARGGYRRLHDKRGGKETACMNAIAKGTQSIKAYDQVKVRLKTSENSNIGVAISR